MKSRIGGDASLPLTVYFNFRSKDSIIGNIDMNNEDQFYNEGKTKK